MVEHLFGVSLPKDVFSLFYEIRTVLDWTFTKSCISLKGTFEIESKTFTLECNKLKITRSGTSKDHRIYALMYVEMHNAISIGSTSRRRIVCGPSRVMAESMC
jgi:hypothetical protein